jgi:hypothetical protein
MPYRYEDVAPALHDEDVSLMKFKLRRPESKTTRRPIESSNTSNNRTSKSRNNTIDDVEVRSHVVASTMKILW